MDVEQAFGPLRPYCSALAAKPNQKILDQLIKVVNQTNPNQLQQLEEYIVFPMQIYLKTPVLPENYTINVLNFVADFYGKVQLTSAFILKDFLRNVLPISSKEPVSEDLKVAISKFFSSLFSAASVTVQNEVIYNSQCKLPISHVVFQSLEWSSNESAPNMVVLSALDAVHSLCGDSDDFCTQFSPMLPGITSKLVKTIQTAKKSHKIVVKVVNIWTDLVTVLLKDSQDLKTDLGQAQDHLQQHLQVFHSFANHERIQVRKAILRLCGRILCKCSGSMQPWFNLLIETLAVLSVDLESETLSHDAEKCLEEYLVAKGNVDDVTRETQAKIHALSSEILSKTSILLNEKELYDKLCQLQGFLLILVKVESSSLFFYSETYVGRLLDALLEVVALDTRILIGSNLLKDFSNFDFVFRPELHLKLTRLEKSFQHLNTQGQFI